MRSDLRLAWRLLVKDRWFTLAAVAVLALGIAATNTVFTLVNGVLLRDMPFAEPDRIVQLGDISYPEQRDWNASARTFAGIGAAYEQPMNVADAEVPPARFRGAFVTANTFAILRQPPALGRVFNTEDERVGGAPVVVLSHDVWRIRYESDPGIVGRSIRVNGVPSVVVGVMPAGVEFPMNAKLWQPLTLLPTDVRDNRSTRVIDGFGRLQPGTTIQQARSDLAAIAATLSRTYPESQRDAAPVVEPFRSGIGAPIVAVLMAMMGAVVFVLLIACANVANLLLARAAQRSREVSVRMALGASRARIVRQLLVESLLLAGIAGVAALALSAASIRLFWRIANEVGDPPPFWLTFPIDAQVFSFLAASCLGTSVLFGLVPALHTSRTNIVGVLNEGGRGSTGHRRSRTLTGALVVAQLALTLVLLTGAGLMMQNLLAVVRMEAGVDTARLVRMGLDLPAAGYETAAQRALFYQQLDERLAATPGLQAALASGIPMGGAPQVQMVTEDLPEPTGELPRETSTVTIGSRYFQTVGVPLVRGRDFIGRDGEASARSAIVNRRFAEMHFGGGDPLGRRIRLGREGDWMTIVGVVNNIRQRTLQTGQFDPVVYVPLAGNPPGRTNIIVRSNLETGRLASVLREQVRAIDADLPLYDVRTVDEQLAMSRWPQRVFGSMFAIFAAIALVLAVVGLYAVTAYSVTQRTQEIGVRLALGARAREIWWLVTRRASGQLAAGVAIGGAGAVAAARVLPSVLAGTGGVDWLTLIGIAGLLLLIGLAACLIPARRAMRLDPVVALRVE
jgi:predicted permease